MLSTLHNMPVARATPLLALLNPRRSSRLPHRNREVSGASCLPTRATRFYVAVLPFQRTQR